MKYLFTYSDCDFNISHTLTRTPDLSKYRMHTHDTTELFYFIKGSGTYHIEGSEYPLESGDLLIMRPSESHYVEIKPDEPYERVTINFKTDFFSSIDTHNILLKAILERKSGKLNQYKSYDFKNKSYKKYIENIITQSGDTRINIISNLMPLLNEIYSAFISKEAEDNTAETVEYRLIRYINKHISDDINLDSLAHKYYISKPQLCRIFKKATGTTVWQYITIKRLMKARNLILSGENPTRIYTECGFNDYSAFYRAYVKNFGHPPRKEIKP